FDLRWHLDPVSATQAGVTGYDDRYGRFSPGALSPHLAALKSLAAALEEATVEGLDEEIDRTALLNEIRVMVRRYEKLRPQATNPEFWLSHLLGGLHHLLLSGDRSPAEKARAALGRLEDTPAFIEDARASLTEPVEVFVETALRMSEGGRSLVGAIAALVGFEQDLTRWLDTAGDHFAIGEEEFNFLLHYQHALRDTAPELWRYGHRLKAEVEADLEQRAKRLDGGRPWPEIADQLRADHPSAQELVD